MLKTLSRVLHSGLVRVQRGRMRSELLTLSDHALQDAGFSRELLLEGVRAWPWRTAEEEKFMPLNFSAVELRQVHQLKEPLASNQEQNDHAMVA